MFLVVCLFVFSMSNIRTKSDHDERRSGSLSFSSGVTNNNDKIRGDGAAMEKQDDDDDEEAAAAVIDRYFGGSSDDYSLISSSSASAISSCSNGGSSIAAAPNPVKKKRSLPGTPGPPNNLYLQLFMNQKMPSYFMKEDDGIA